MWGALDALAANAAPHEPKSCARVQAPAERLVLGQGSAALCAGSGGVVWLDAREQFVQLTDLADLAAELSRAGRDRVTRMVNAVASAVPAAAISHRLGVRATRAVLGWSVKTDLCSAQTTRPSCDIAYAPAGGQLGHSPTHCGPTERRSPWARSAWCVRGEGQWPSWCPCSISPLLGGTIRSSKNQRLKPARSRFEKGMRPSSFGRSINGA